MELPELREFLAPEPLVLRIAGKTYEIAVCSALTWTKLQVVRADIIAQGEDKFTIELSELWDMALGDGVAKTMFENGVRSTEITHSAWTAFYWHLGMEQTAREVWTGGPRADEAEPAGKAAAPALKKTTTRSRRTAGASTTRSRASGSRTRKSQTS